MRIETERLVLRRPTEADVESPPAWLSDPAVMDWLGGVDPPRAVVRRWLEDWERFPTGKLLVERAGDLVGRVGFNYYDLETWRRTPDGVPELGWALAREHWGRGYATEAARAVLDRLAPPTGRVVSLIAPANARSQAVARRLGAEPAETVEMPDGAGPHVVWVHGSAKIRVR